MVMERMTVILTVCNKQLSESNQQSTVNNHNVVIISQERHFVNPEYPIQNLEISLAPRSRGS